MKYFILVLFTLLLASSAEAQVQVQVGDSVLIQKVRLRSFNFATLSKGPGTQVPFGGPGPFFYQIDSEYLYVSFLPRSPGVFRDTVLLLTGLIWGNPYDTATIIDSAIAIPATTLTIEPRLTQATLAYDTAMDDWHETFHFSARNFTPERDTITDWNALLGTNDPKLLVTDDNGKPVSFLVIDTGQIKSFNIQFRIHGGPMYNDTTIVLSLLSSITSGSKKYKVSDSLVFKLLSPDFTSYVTAEKTHLIFKGEKNTTLQDFFRFHFKTPASVFRISGFSFPFLVAKIDSQLTEDQIFISVSPESDGDYKSYGQMEFHFQDKREGSHALLVPVSLEAIIKSSTPDSIVWHLASFPISDTLNHLFSWRDNSVYGYGPAGKLFRIEPGGERSKIMRLGSVTFASINSYGEISTLESWRYMHFSMRDSQWHLFNSQVLSGPFQLSPEGIIWKSDTDIICEGYNQQYIHNSFGVKDCYMHTSDQGVSWTKIDCSEQSGYFNNGIMPIFKYTLAIDSQGRPFSSETDVIPNGYMGESKVVSGVVGDTTFGLNSTGFAFSDSKIREYRGLEGHTPTSLCVLPSRELLASTSDAGVYRSTDFGNSWYGMNGGLPSTNISTMCTAPDGNAYCFVPGYGLYISKRPSRVSVTEQKQTPIRFSIRPNPVRSRIQIMGISGIRDVQFLNELGVVVLETKDTPTDWISTAKLRPGIYYARILGDAGWVTGRMVKE